MFGTQGFIVVDGEHDSVHFATEAEAQQHAYTSACTDGHFRLIVDVATNQSWEVFPE